MFRAVRESKGLDLCKATQLAGREGRALGYVSRGWLQDRAALSLTVVQDYRDLLLYYNRKHGIPSD